MKHKALLRRFGVPEVILSEHPDRIMRIGDARPRMQRDDGGSEMEIVQGRVYIEGVITASARQMREYGYAAVSARDVRLQIEGQEDKSAQLEFRVNSVGGSLSEGASMTAEISDYEGTKLCYVTGMAASVATYVPMVCDRTAMAEQAEFFMHLPYAVFMGNYIEMRKKADTLEKTAKNVAAHYAKASGLSVDKVLEIMTEETYLSAQETVDRGFADEVRETVVPKGGNTQNRMQAPGEFFRQVADMGFM